LALSTPISDFHRLESAHAGRTYSKNIPQADVLSEVVKTVVTVGNGAKSDIEIGNALGKVDRQGRYYRNAAELLGFINNNKNTAVLTTIGKQFLLDPSINNPLLLKQVLSIQIFQRFISFLELHPEGIDRNNMIKWLQEVTENASKSILHRRINSISSWLQSLEIIKITADKLSLTNKITEKISILEVTEPDEPILPKTSDLNEYSTVHQRLSNANEVIAYYKDSAKTDRANLAHISLVNDIAKRIRDINCIPKANQLIDLASKIYNIDYIFEMKSINLDNERSQLRKGVSQLFEYRYLQDLPQAILVLVFEKPLSTKNIWMLDYLSSISIIPVWNETGSYNTINTYKNQINFLIHNRQSS